MAVTLIVEDGTGVTDANTYISLADAEIYFESRLNTTDWDALIAVPDTKNRALVQATRTLDSRVTWQGVAISNQQALGWPRDDVLYEGDVWPATQVPPDVLDATCEQALYLLGADRTADYQGAGIKSVNLGNEALDVEFDQTSEAGLLPDAVLDMLAPWTTSLGGRIGSIPTVRV